MPNTDILLRELNHRVKNNFQIIVSLMNLKKRLLPPERRDDLRFIEEHVQSMAVAYRLVYATGDMSEVSVGHLLAELVSELRQIARLSLSQTVLNGYDIQGTMGLDQAISFGLFLAVVLPPYFDDALKYNGVVSISAGLDGADLTFSVTGSWVDPVASDYLRTRLSDAYAGQLQAVKIPLDGPGLKISFQLDDRRSTIARSADATGTPASQRSI
jgi:hypothetical protein